jgi:hypothetical protein
MQTRIPSYVLALCVLLATPQHALPDVSFSGQIIISQGVADGPGFVVAADLDGDGDSDVLVASRNDDTIAWHENIDGAGTFGPEQVITTAADLPAVALAADLDGDEDLDVVTASYLDDKLAWHENTDSQGIFGSQNVITTTADGAISLSATDLDGDQDVDLVVACWESNRVSWYENDGNGSFGPENVISSTAEGVRFIHTADLDGDEDQDVLAACSEGDRVTWYENEGGGSFGPESVVTANVLNVLCVFAADLDGDSDIDVLSASSDDDKIAWYENTNGTGVFGPQQVITTATDYAYFVIAGDLDRDSDMDVISGSSLDDKVAWYENLDGNGSFGPQQVISTEADFLECVCAADLDRDEDLDIISASLDDDKVAWYRCEAITAIFNEADSHACTSHLEQNCPNPFRSPTAIRFALNRSSLATLTVYDVAGRRIRILLSEAVSSGAHSLVWDGTDDKGLPLAGGMYFCRLVTDTGVADSIRLILLR